MSYNRKKETFSLVFESHRSTSDDAATEIYVAPLTIRKGKDIKVDVLPEGCATVSFNSDKSILSVKLNSSVADGTSISIDITCN